MTKVLVVLTGAKEWSLKDGSKQNVKPQWTFNATTCAVLRLKQP